jgi:hypothetical protein
VRVNEHATLDIIGFCDTDGEWHQFLGRPVWRNPTEADAHDVCVLTDLLDPRTSYDQLASLIDRERILVPDVLGLEASNL